MKIKNNITTAIIAAATGMLQPFIPDLTPTRLIAALKAYDSGSSEEGQKNNGCGRKPMTIQAVCNLLSISRPSVYRLKERGKIRFIKVGSLTRIPAEDVQCLLTGNRKETPTS